MNKNEMNPYKVNKISKLPTSLKVFIIKAWTAGMVFYFIFMSFEVFNVLPSHEDRWLVSAFVLILLNEYFVNWLIKGMELKKVKQRKHAMFISFKYSLVANIGYILAVVFLTIFAGTFLISKGISLTKIFNPYDEAAWEPITFGLFYYSIDTILILTVNLVKKILIKKEPIVNEI